MIVGVWTGDLRYPILSATLTLTLATEPAALLTLLVARVDQDLVDGCFGDIHYQPPLLSMCHHRLVDKPG